MFSLLSLKKKLHQVLCLLSSLINPRNRTLSSSSSVSPSDFDSQKLESVKMLEKVDEFDMEKSIEDFEAMTKDAERVQRKTLKKILEENRSAEYWQGFGLNGRTDPESFKAFVPLVTHKDLDPFIQRIADGDSSPILTGKPVPSISVMYFRVPKSISFLFFVASSVGLDFFVVLEKFSVSVMLYNICSSGTTQGRPKFLPFTDELMETTMQIFQTSFAFRNREYPIANGRALQIIYSSKQFKTRGGLPVGTATTNVYRNHKFKTTMKSMQSQCCSPDEDTRIHHVKFVSINQNTCRTSIREYRASIVSDQVSDTGYGTKQKYPCIIAIEPYLKKLRHYAGELPLLSADYGSSEGWVGANVNPKLPPELATFAVIPNVWYYEFIPLRNNSGEQPVGLTEITVGEEYEVVLTSVAGLYRYRIGDIVKVVGFYNSTPEIKFVCRSNLLLSIDIDKNTEKELQLSVEEAAKLLAAEKLEVVDFSSHVDLSTDPGRYVIFWELNGEPNHEVLSECCNCLDKAFVDVGYMSSRKVNTIGPLELRILRKGTFQKILTHYLVQGAAASQFKTPRCVGLNNKKVLQILCGNAVRSFFSTAYDEVNITSSKPNTFVVSKISPRLF